MFGIPVTKIVVLGVVGIAAYAYITSGGKPIFKNTSDAAAACEFTVNADLLYIRNGPGTDSSKVGSYPHDAAVTATKTVQNGFRQVDGTHWVSNDFLVPKQGNTC